MSVTNSHRAALRLYVETVHRPRRDRAEDGFEIAQSMGIALLGLVVAAAFATALEALGVDVVTRIRAELGL
ncbi:MAG: hypothetical protein AAF962_04030 [Actinomycetota bacterium]